MMKAHRRTVVTALLLGVLLFSGIALGLAYAADDGDIHACVSPSGRLRIVASAEVCRNNEDPLTWKILGRIGPQGLKGDDGPQGLPGDKGEAGPLDLAGDVCLAGQFLNGFDSNGDILCAVR